jgi:hypothetical protein
VIAYHIDVQDLATPGLQRVRGGLAPAQLNPVVGRAAANATKEHFIALNRERPNALGGTRTNYYLGAARGTSYRVVEDGVIISIAQVGIAQRYYGGTIRRRLAKFLTIPARAEAHGKRASEFPDLIVLWRRRGGLREPYALARAVSTQIGFRRSADGSRTISNRGVQGGEIIFWLKREVTQSPDPSVAPAPDKIYGAVISNVTAHVERLAARAGNGGAS